MGCTMQSLSAQQAAEIHSRVSGVDRASIASRVTKVYHLHVFSSLTSLNSHAILNSSVLARCLRDAFFSAHIHRVKQPHKQLAGNKSYFSWIINRFNSQKHKKMMSISVLESIL